VLDHAGSIGQKIRVSGGGRCNFTNIHMAPRNTFPAIRTSVNQRLPALVLMILSVCSKNTALNTMKRKKGNSFAKEFP